MFQTLTTSSNFTENKNTYVLKQIEALEKIWGPYYGGIPKGQLLGERNIEPRDILEYYNGREIYIPAQQITAYLLNTRNLNSLKVFAPWVYSDELNWRTVIREINLVTFDNVAEGSPFNLLTMRTGTTTDTTRKKKLGINITSGVYRDPVFGEDQFEFFMRGLAQCSELTIMLDECFALIIVGFLNACRATDGSDNIDHSKFINQSGQLFGILAYDPLIYWKYVEEVRSQEIPTADTVIIPDKTAILLQALKGTPQMVYQEVIFPESQVGQPVDVKVGKVEGPTSLMTVNGMNIHVLNSFTLNSENQQVIQPFKTAVVIARVFPDDPNYSEACRELYNQCMLDIKVYCHSTTYGEEKTISYSKKLEHCFLFDKHTNEPSGYLNSFAEKKNKDIQVYNKLPKKWELLQQILPGHGVNADDGYDDSRPVPGSTESKKTVAEQEGWRDDFCGLTYNPDDRLYRVPKRIGDMNKGALPNKYIQIVSDNMIHHLKQNNIDLDLWINDLKSFFAKIDQTPWSENYLNQLYLANLQRLRFSTKSKERRTLNEDFYEKRTEREEIYGKKIAVDWTPNFFGGFDLPSIGVNLLESYPPGFANAPGLRTIAAQLNSSKSPYSPIAQEADRLVRVGTQIVEYIKKFIDHESDHVNENYTKLWQSKTSSLATLIENIAPRPPLFLAVYDVQVNEEVLSGGNKKSAGWSEVAPYITDPLYLFFYNKDADLKKIYNIIAEKQFLSADDFKLIEDFVLKNGLPESLLSLRFWLFYVLLGREISLKITELSEVNKYKDTIDQFLDKALLHIMDSEKLNKANITKMITITTTVPKPPILNRITEVILVVNSLFNEKNKEKTKKIALDTVNFKDFENDVTPTNLITDAGIKKSLVTINVSNIIIKSTTPTSTTSFESIRENFEKYLNTIKEPSNVNAELQSSLGEPSAFIRTPLTLSEQLISFITFRTKGVGKIDILPGDVNTNWNFPLNLKNLEGITPHTTSLKKVLEKIKYTLKSPSIGLKDLPSGEAFKMKLLNNNFKSKSIDDGMDIDDDDDERESSSGIFTISKKTSYKSKPKPKEYSDIVQSIFDKGFSDDDDGETASSIPFDAPMDRHLPGHYKHKKDPLPASTEKNIDDAFRNEFPGPWESNIKYMNEIQSDGSALLFSTIIFSPFTMRIFRNVSKLGLKLLNIDIMRNSEEHDMCSTIVMKAGSSTMIMVFGRIAVIPSIDGISGEITVSAEFHVGYVRINPKNIKLIPQCVPHTFRGGCDDSFIETPEGFFVTNALGRKSFFSVPASVSFKDRSYPTNIIGDATYKAPDIENTANIYRKYPSAEWINHLLGRRKVDNANAFLKVISNYYQTCTVSFVCHLGCRRLPDSKGKFPKISRGTGPKQFPEMNYGDAFMGWNGQGAFPLLTAGFKEH